MTKILRVEENTPKFITEKEFIIEVQEAVEDSIYGPIMQLEEQYGIKFFRCINDRFKPIRDEDIEIKYIVTLEEKGD